ncbi:hypothetical protein BDQ17DRAFT_1393795 [Cyathus striatus]|nr:hypothetical protein BDQ17DRAFT_1393795 [Cyathus striatus]
MLTPNPEANSSPLTRISTVGYCLHQLLVDPAASGSKMLTKRRTPISMTIVQHSGIDRPELGTGIKITFEDSKGNLTRAVEAGEGHEYDIDLGGACGADDDENDMLDMAFGLTDTSRLGCQVKLTKEIRRMVVKLPSATRNVFVDGV